MDTGLQYMASGRNGHLGVCVHSHVVEAKELGQGHAYLPSMGEDRVMDLKHNTNLAILRSALPFAHGRNPNIIQSGWVILFIILIVVKVYNQDGNSVQDTTQANDFEFVQGYD
ncbi:hypothetical protein WISP_111548 [Willisornis vidua]|uniref:Uncharacterized protein n=1 Tax=Willisornis vidua TaxID=1566151 RepID=A0ABQ9CVD2_9PASS|nr:hypothetical protein WISP_111548 [Willisornis vidua]